MSSLLESVPAAHKEDGAKPLFFPVSVAKLIVLSVFTAGLYELFWFYKNWCLIRGRENSEIWPFWRAFFSYIFCFAMFTKVREQQNQLHESQPLPAGPLAAAWILVNLLWNLPDPYWLICFSTVLFLVPVQLVAMRINAAVAPNHDRNARFTLLNWATIAIGAAFLALVLIGTFMPAQDA